MDKIKDSMSYPYYSKLMPLLYALFTQHILILIIQMIKFKQKNIIPCPRNIFFERSQIRSQTIFIVVQNPYKH